MTIAGNKSFLELISTKAITYFYGLFRILLTLAQWTARKADKSLNVIPFLGFSGAMFSPRWPHICLHFRPRIQHGLGSMRIWSELSDWVIAGRYCRTREKKFAPTLGIVGFKHLISLEMFMVLFSRNYQLPTKLIWNVPGWLGGWVVWQW